MTSRSGTMLLFPGAGSGRDQPTLVRVDAAVSALPGWSTVRADFPYRKAGRRAPDKPEVLMAAVREELAAIGSRRNVVIGGRSMGGRICSMVAAGVDGLAPPKRLLGVVTISYPLHPARQAGPAARRTPSRGTGAVAVRPRHARPVRLTGRVAAVDEDDQWVGDPPLARRWPRPQGQGRRRSRRWSPSGWAPCDPGGRGVPAVPGGTGRPNPRNPDRRPPRSGSGPKAAQIE